MDPELARFFAHWVPLLRGQRSVPEVQLALGDSRSSESALGFYRTLMERNAAAILGSLFPATRAVFIAAAPRRWLPTVSLYEQLHPAVAFDPNEFGRQFPGFLADARRERGLPAGLEEVADYEWARYALAAGVAVGAGEALLDSANVLVVRHYDYDVPKITRDVSAGVAPSDLMPRPVNVLLYRDLESGNARAIYPSHAALLALARRAPGPTKYGGHDLTLAAIYEAERELEALGILTPGSSVVQTT